MQWNMQWNGIWIIIIISILVLEYVSIMEWSRVKSSKVESSRVVWMTRIERERERGEGVGTFEQRVLGRTDLEDHCIVGGCAS
mmetsp:Transcript_5090/g.12508  ORF Transcript_5090/g.12508 Transcript_5090/m.12508 type:complete len:83 (-) Transcript_5090:68-316(-)